MLSILFLNILGIVNPPTQLEGKVIDQQGSAITYAMVTTSDESSLTNIEGNFKLDASGDTIVISALGYETVRIPSDRFSGVIVLSPASPKNVTIRKQ
jgi:hypothetical protein